MRELLSGFVRGLPEEVADRVLARAEGVPLYAVETVRMLADRGVLVSRGGATRSPESWQTPRSRRRFTR